MLTPSNHDRARPDCRIRRRFASARIIPPRRPRPSGLLLPPPVFRPRSAGKIPRGLATIRQISQQTQPLSPDHHLGLHFPDPRTSRPRRTHADLGRIRPRKLRLADLEERHPEEILRRGNFAIRLGKKGLHLPRPLRLTPKSRSFRAQQNDSQSESFCGVEELAVQRQHPPRCQNNEPSALNRKSTRLNSSHLGISYAV